MHTHRVAPIKAGLVAANSDHDYHIAHGGYCDQITCLGALNDPIVDRAGNPDCLALDSVVKRKGIVGIVDRNAFGIDGLGFDENSVDGSRSNAKWAADALKFVIVDHVVSVGIVPAILALEDRRSAAVLGNNISNSTPDGADCQHSITQGAVCVFAICINTLSTMCMPCITEHRVRAHAVAYHTRNNAMELNNSTGRSSADWWAGEENRLFDHNHFG